MEGTWTSQWQANLNTMQKMASSMSGDEDRCFELHIEMVIRVLLSNIQYYRLLLRKLAYTDLQQSLGTMQILGHSNEQALRVSVFEQYNRQ